MESTAFDLALIKSLENRSINKHFIHDIYRDYSKVPDTRMKDERPKDTKRIMTMSL